jgi:hypothetical protein
MTINTLAIGGPCGVLKVTSNSAAEEGGAMFILKRHQSANGYTKNRRRYTAHSLFRIQHSLCPFLALVARTTNYLRPTELVLPRLGALVGDTRAIEHFMESKLFDQLSPSVR